MATKKVIDIDRGWKKILREIRRTPNELDIIIGIQGAQAGEDNGGLTNATLGVIHEFGAPAAGIPQRAVLRGTVDRERKKYMKLIANAASRFSIGQGLKKQLEVIGELAVSDVRKTFDRSTGLAKLKATTIRRKGSTKPLINEGQLKGSYTSVVK